MTIESKLGEGTTIYIIYLLPTRRYSRLMNKKTSDIPAVEEGFLAMDDEEMIRKLLQNSLTEIGYRVELAGDGSEAIEKYIKAEKSGTSLLPSFLI